MTRRKFIALAAAAGPIATAGGEAAAAADDAPKQCSMGIVEFAVKIHRDAWRQQKKADLGDPLEFLREARRLGAGGVQMAIPHCAPAHAEAVKRFAREHRIFLEANIPPPRDADDVPRFEQHVRTAIDAGARLARTVIIPGRRYEQFKTPDAFRDACRRGEQSLRLAEPVLARHRFPLAVENHKDQRVDERLDLFERLGSEFVGACVDLGNSFALMEDPLEVVRAFAPFALAVHIKDQAAREYADGFEYADVPLGDGFLDLPAMIATLKRARPDVRFSFESITRDPLKVPVLTDAYWTTFDRVPPRDLTRTLRTVRAHASEKPFPLISPLPADEQVAAERAMLQKSIRYARERLGL